MADRSRRRQPAGRTVLARMGTRGFRKPRGGDSDETPNSCSTASESGCRRPGRFLPTRFQAGEGPGHCAGSPPPSDPVHAEALEQIDELLKWDRAMRADAFDSVHQMRVIIRKIRSLLQASEGAFGLTDDASILRELRELAAVLGVARDAGSWPNATSGRWPRCHRNWSAARYGNGW